MRDPAHWSFPLRVFMRQEILAGRLPAWDPTQALGFPLISDPLLGLFYPPNWLYLLPNTARIVTFDSLLHLVLGGVGVMTLLRRLGVVPIATLLGGIAWALSGISIGMWTAGLLLQAMAWLPWAALAGWSIGTLARSPQVRPARAARTVAVAALPTTFGLLQGEIFVAAMGCALAAGTAWCAAGGLGSAPLTAKDRSAPTRTPLRRVALLGCLAAVLAGGIAAVNVLPVRQAAAGTARAAPLSVDQAEIWSFAPLRLVGMIAPGSMGHPLLGNPGGRWVGDPRRGGEVLSFSVYLGATVVALVLLAFGRNRRLALALGAMATLALLVAMGRHLPLHQFTRWLLPPLMYMRYPEKYLVVVAAIVPVLAGLGADRLLSEPRRVWRRHVVFLLVLVGLAGLSRLFPGPLRGHVATASLYGAAVVTLLMALIALRRLSSRTGSGVLVAVVVLDLALPSWGLVDFVDADLPYRRAPAVQQVLAGAGSSGVRPRIYRYSEVDRSVGKFVKAASATEYENRGLVTLIANTVNIHGIASLPGYDAAIPASWESLFTAGIQQDPVALFRLTDTRFVVTATTGLGAIPSLRGLTPTGMDPLPGSRLFRVDRPLPRVYAVGRTELHDGREPWNRLFSGDVLDGRIALVRADQPLALLSGPPGAAGRCQIERHVSDEIQVNCTLERDAMIVFVEQEAPGWSATVDGTPSPILTVNHLMRGVRAGPGPHRLRLVYQPPGRLPSIALSLLSLLVLVGLLLWDRRKPVNAPVAAGSKATGSL